MADETNPSVQPGQPAPGGEHASTPIHITTHNQGKDSRMSKKSTTNAEFDGIPEYAPACGGQIPPPLNPDVPAMADCVSACYTDVAQRIRDFKEEVITLADTGKLDPAERSGMLEHYDDLETALHAAKGVLPILSNGPQMLYFPYDGRWDDHSLNHFADHAKYVYAVGERDIAALQYRLGELAHNGQLNAESNESLQWNCLLLWKRLYSGTTLAVRDHTTSDEFWDWCDNTYSDGRTVRIQVRPENWERLECELPFRRLVVGDVPLFEHPWASTSRINPVIAPGGF